MIMAILGFLAPFIPDLLGFGRAALDHKFEMDMMKLRISANRDAALHRLEEVEIRAQVQENIAARKPHQSFGIQMLDKAAEAEGVIWRWSMNFVFLAFAHLDLMISSVRPVITFYVFGLFGAVKIATFYRLYEITESVPAALLHEMMWTQFDNDMLLIVLGFWFGDRVRRRASQEKNGR